MLFNPNAGRLQVVELPPNFPKEGYVRLNNILAPRGPLPVGKTTLWQWVRDGKFPRPVKLSTRVTAWKAEDVQAFLAAPNQWEAK
jgi:predicted DNA-binding transcriptional regulator AlpA